MKFPSVKATSLTNRSYQLPRDLDGELNVVIVAFKQWQQDWVDTWVPALQRLAYEHPALRVYEMPTMSRFNGLYRFMIDNGMRAGIPDKAVRAATLCAYIDLSPFTQALQLPTYDSIYLFLLDRAGEILWRGQGVFDQAQCDELAATVERLTSAKPETA
jgi:ATP10 protein